MSFDWTCITRPDIAGSKAKVVSLISTECEYSGLTDLDNIGTGDWIKNVHIPCMRFYFQQCQNYNSSGNQSINSDSAGVSIRGVFRSRSDIVYDLILTSIANDRRRSIDADSCCIQDQCMRYHEMMLGSLLELWLSRTGFITCLDESVCELFAYCYRKIIKLTEKHLSEFEFRLGLFSITIARHLVINRDDAVCLLSRQIFVDFDYLLLLIYLLDDSVKPWNRDGKKFDDDHWVPESPKLCLAEGNIWLSIWSLVLSKEVHNGQYDIMNQLERILSLRRLLTNVHIDQIPPLLDLKRFLEELTLSQKMPNTVPKLKPFSVIQETLYDRKKDDYKNLEIITDQTVLVDISKALAKVYDEIDWESTVAPPPNAYTVSPLLPVCVVCNMIGAENRCSHCKSAVYCSQECQMKDWPIHKTLCKRD